MPSWDFDLTGFTTALPVARGGTGLTALGTANQVLAVNAGATALEYQTAAGGQLQTQIFTSPGTWTNPGTVTKVQVFVVGGGGGGAQPNVIGQSPSGGTSSFGPYVSATGGTGGTRPPPGAIIQGVDGTGTVSSGVVISAGGPGSNSFAGGLIQSNGNGSVAPSPAAIAYSATNCTVAGQGGQSAGASGGIASALVTIPTSPVTVTVGAGGTGSGGPARGGVGGAIAVEWIA
jgi:hypothetical protein